MPSLILANPLLGGDRARTKRQKTMGKKDKKSKHHHQQQRNSRKGAWPDDLAGSDASYYLKDRKDEEEELLEIEGEEEEEEEEEEREELDSNPSTDLPSKFHLYQQSVQSPKGDISYLLKFFLMYVGGRQPLHFQEDFCGTALLSTEWLRNDSRRTAVGLDLDLEALEWCTENNITKIGADGYSRMLLFHGNVLNPHEAKLVNFETQDRIQKIRLDEDNATLNASTTDESLKKYCELPARDIVCAFNYSCCCLHKRGDLVAYFKHALNALSKRGGIFVMDLYGGTSAEKKLTLQRRFPTFKYIWEQAEFDVVSRKTRISLHYNLLKQQKKIRHAFSYSWRLWSLPEIKDCLEEAGFTSVHFWLREMPDTAENRSTVGFGAGRDVKYEEVSSFEQCDAWNAYIVAVAK